MQRRLQASATTTPGHSPVAAGLSTSLVEQPGKRPWRRKKRRNETPRTTGAPIIADPPGSAAISAARFAIFFTIVAWLIYLIEQTLRVMDVGLTPRTFVETTLYLVLVTLLTASAVAYLLARLGYFERIKTHRRVPRSAIDSYFDKHQPTMTVLVPSYREEERIVRLTLLSAALQEYPHLRVVLLIDDPPNPSDPQNRALLERSRSLATALTETIAGPRRRFEDAVARFEAESSRETVADEAMLEQLAAHYDSAACWFEQEQAELTCTDHIDTFFAIEFLQRMAHDLRTNEQAIRAVARDPASCISRQRVYQLLLRLQRIFQAEFCSFERKQFASLSHEPNKAMNLNSYIGLMGQQFNVVTSPVGKVLVAAEDSQADLVIPDTDYVLTLDADSMLLPEYCLRLVYFMEQAENTDVAIAQTPYSAYRGTESSIERIAGATTDIQHLVHLGLTRYEATFWVGANAVIRKRALDDLESTSDESGFVIRRYISDRTVIEDTESSIELREKGWRLYNYPERLSYSATPPDFGSLVIQRRRWANGGLVILPRMLRLLGRRPDGSPRPSLAELFLRVSYLASISWATVSLLLLLFYPFDDHLLSRFAVLTAVPYWWAMSSDLKRVGYHWRDIFQVYGFNLLLLPVNLAGTFQSLVQAIGGQRTPFARTPKVDNHTVAPLLYLLLPLVLLVWSAVTLQYDFVTRSYIHGAFALTNLVTIAFACVVFIGFKHLIIDLFMNVRAFVYRPAVAQPREPEVPHWAAVLYVGSSVPEETRAGAPLAAALAAQDLYVNGGRAMVPGSVPPVEDDGRGPTTSVTWVTGER